ncbi:MAG: ABC transporter ATP-binding protein [Candidatus Pelethousia sp.]|nr:ABC transporter ATP-binding protein [Candidatus Pelethousia sp.]
MALLEITNITKRFGGLTALDSVNLQVEQGEIVGLIGPNGAGKTTLFSVIAGYAKPDMGRVVFKGKDITNWETYRIAKMGMNRTFQVVKPFSDMNVLENVMVGALMRSSSVKDARKKAMETLEFCSLADKADFLGKELTVAAKKRLEVARALASDPSLLLLDEVMAGLNPSEVHDAVQLIHRIHDRGVTLLVIEHVMEVIMPISDRVAVLNYGKKIADCEPEKAVHDPQVIAAYFGTIDDEQEEV